MKRALFILSFVNVLLIGLAMIGQALSVARDITFTPDGRPTDPSALNYLISSVADIGSGLAIPLTLATFVVGLVAMGNNKAYGWLVALCVAGGLSFVGVLVMAWVILSGNSPIAFATPMAPVAITALIYSIRAPSAQPKPMGGAV